jgi:hypothetical protein
VAVSGACGLDDSVVMVVNLGIGFTVLSVHENKDILIKLKSINERLYGNGFIDIINILKDLKVLLKYEFLSSKDFEIFD